MASLGAWGVIFVVMAAQQGSFSVASNRGSREGLGWSNLVVATVGMCLLEAVTTQLDNLFIPLQYLALLLR